MKQQEYTPLYADVKKAIEDDKEPIMLDVSEYAIKPKTSDLNVSEILYYRRLSTFLFIMALVIFTAELAVTFCLKFLIYNRLFTLGILIKVYIFESLAVIMSNKMYKFIDNKSRIYMIVVLILFPIIGFVYVYQFRHDCNEFLHKNCSEAELKKYRIR